MRHVISLMGKPPLSSGILIAPFRKSTGGEGKEKVGHQQAAATIFPAMSPNGPVVACCLVGVTSASTYLGEKVRLEGSREQQGGGEREEERWR